MHENQKTFFHPLAPDTCTVLCCFVLLNMFAHRYHLTQSHLYTLFVELSKEILLSLLLKCILILFIIEILAIIVVIKRKRGPSAQAWASLVKIKLKLVSFLCMNGKKINK